MYVYFENEFLDFKLEAYDWNLSEKKEDFFKDTLSLANSITENDRLIILGVKVKPDGDRVIKGIDVNSLKDSSVYQQFVTEHIEPELSIEISIKNINGNDFGIIRIFNCNNRPYLIKKKFGDLDTGFIKTGRGSRNTNISRYFLDEIYALKNLMEKSEFRIYGLDNEYITENIKLKEFNCLPNIFDEKEKLTNLLEKINNIVINDYNDDEDEKEFNISSNIGLYSKIRFPSTKMEVDAEIVNNIDSFAKVIGFKINDDFYKLGNLRERFTGIKASNLLNISQEYEIEGSKMSKEKYKLILELDMQLKKLFHGHNL